jgi:hypothetical protein
MHSLRVRACNRSAALHRSRFAPVCSANHQQLKVRRHIVYQFDFLFVLTVEIAVLFRVQQATAASCYKIGVSSNWRGTLVRILGGSPGSGRRSKMQPVLLGYRQRGCQVVKRFLSRSLSTAIASQLDDTLPLRARFTRSGRFAELRNSSHSPETHRFWNKTLFVRLALADTLASADKGDASHGPLPASAWRTGCSLSTAAWSNTSR